MTDEKTANHTPAATTPADADPAVTGTVGSPNPKTGSADAARGLGGHSKDASHDKGAPAGYVENGKPTTP